jgi:hypothetical protein
MIQRFNAFFEKRASGRGVFLWFGLTLMWGLIFGIVLVPAFEAATSGFRPVDLALPTTPELIFGQLPAYTEASYRVYAWFAVVDFLYPPTLAMFISILWAWMFAKTPNRFFEILQSKGILLLPFIAAFLDWSENTGFLIVIFGYPREFWGVAEMACALKTAKVSIHALDILLTLLFGITSIAVGYRRRRGFS